MSADVLWLDAQRRRLVRLCAGISGDHGAAEDLAQETLLEAWRNRHKLHDPAGADRWLAAIARNVCRRWASSRGRDVAAALIVLAALVVLRAFAPRRAAARTNELRAQS
jgi:DNA-directed RNA polymerase specialized sigma24 family protein